MLEESQGDQPDKGEETAKGNLYGKKVAYPIHKKRRIGMIFFYKKMKYLPRIEQIMSLLVFPNLPDCSNFYLTTPEYRSKIAKQVNILLLSS